MTVAQQYLIKIRQGVELGNLTERSYYPALKAWIEELGGGEIAATVEPKRIECGAPDFHVSHKTPHGPLTIGYIEAKDVGASVDEAERSVQLKRYFNALPNLILTDYLEFRWYVGGEHRRTERLGWVGREAKIVSDAESAERVIALLKDFLAHRPEPIAKPRDLARRLARLTHIIRDIIIEAFERNRASEMLCGLRQAFATALIPDLNQPEKTAEFADMYAQTIAYGLFAARCNHRGPGRFRRLGAAAEIPKTNPFLRKLFETITGTELDDEPYAGFVDDLVQLLAATDIGAVLEDFGKREARTDPVVHFYETFLADYDPALRETRGVYYTPEPVVSYIVRSVDELLKTHFGIADGLADRAIVEYIQEVEDDEKTKKVKATSPRVLILDPACGTGTFLYAVADHIREGFMARGDAGMWSGYVRNHLLPRLFGFELLMAPYAVAHFKLSMQLAGYDLPTAALREKWAYDFVGGERLGIYLTNTLEEAERKVEELLGPLRVITEEANAAARIKRDLPILVVMGNPPYSGHSANRSWRIKDEKRVPTFIGELVQDYYQVDGQPLGERNPKWLQDDYVKFIRWGQWRIERTGGGILGLITNHAYLDNPTFRGMRQQLMKTFDEIYLLDLHGGSRKREVAPDGSKDENVFDIQQGVAIALFVKRPRGTGVPAVKKAVKHEQSASGGLATVRHAELWGPREAKAAGLMSRNVATTRWTKLTPRPPFYLFVRQDGRIGAEYAKGSKITRIMPVNVLGFQSHRDHFVIDLDRECLRERMAEMRSKRMDDRTFAQKYDLKDNKGWQLSRARQSIRQNPDWEASCIECAYRPFDQRFCYFSEVLMDRPRRELQLHVAGKENLCLNVVRQTKMPYWRHAVVSRLPAPALYVELKDGSSLFPLYLYPDPEENGDLFPNGCARHPNLDSRFVEDVSAQLRLKSIPDGKGDLKKTFGPEDVFHYIYAVFHSPTYRERYADFLKRDFPHVPLTSDRKLFRRLCALGADLVALHLLEDDYPHASWTLDRKSSPLARPFTRYPLPGDSRVEKGYPKYLAAGQKDPGGKTILKQGRVYINQEQYFEGVPRKVWDFCIGGYQVCEKWLKDRRGRTLSFDDLSHYQKIVVALKETIRLMDEIDQAIPSWPIE